MSYEDIPILVVDDAKFSSAIIAKALRSGGFGNVRFTNNPLQALRSLEKRPAQILIADWLMPGMDGLELSRRVKKLDETNEHFTYVMLLAYGLFTGDPIPEARPRRSRQRELAGSGR